MSRRRDTKIRVARYKKSIGTASAEMHRQVGVFYDRRMGSAISLSLLLNVSIYRARLSSSYLLKICLNLVVIARTRYKTPFD